MTNKKRTMVLVLSLVSVLSIFFQFSVPAMALSDFPLVVLTPYRAELKIGESLQLVAITSTGKKPTFSSSSSRIASVNTYGKVTAKKPGTVTVTAKIKGAEASCKVSVKPTTIAISRITASMENGARLGLSATASNGAPVKWKTNKSSVATVSQTGVVASKKAGTAVITATADGTKVTCTVTVRQPKLALNKTKLSLYRKGSFQLSAEVSSGLPPKWKTNRKSVATVSDQGKVTALKHGTAIITVTRDGASKTCEVVVKQPEVSLSESSLTLDVGESHLLKASVSSGNSPEWRSSNTSVATVSGSGRVNARQSGKAYVYASEDGVKARCTITVKK